MHCTMQILLNPILPENCFDLTAIFISFCFHMLQVFLQSSQQKIDKLLPSRMSKNAHTRQIQKGNRKIRQRLPSPNARDPTKWQSMMKSIAIRNPAFFADGKEPRSKLN